MSIRIRTGRHVVVSQAPPNPILPPNWAQIVDLLVSSTVRAVSVRRRAHVPIEANEVALGLTFAARAAGELANELTRNVLL